MSDWNEPVRRTASLFGGRTEYAEIMAEKALLNRQRSQDSFFPLYRSYLKRVRAWPDPTWGTGLSRFQRAVLVALHHDGWTEQETAHLCGRSKRAVRRAEANGLSALEKDTSLLSAELHAMTHDLPAPTERAPDLDWGGIGCLVISFATLVFFILSTLPAVGPRNPLTEHQAAVPFSAPDPLRSRLYDTIRYAYRVDKEGRDFVDKSGWLVIATSGRRFLVEDATGDDLAISPDGRTLAYHHRDKDKVVVHNLTTGKISTVSGDGELRFSPDGRRLAVMQEDGAIYVWDGESRRVPGTYPDTWLPGWRLDGTLLIEYVDGTRAIDLKGKVKAIVEGDEDLSPDGRTWIEVDEDKHFFTLHGERRGKRPMLLPATARVRSHPIWVSADEFVIRTDGYGPSGFYRVNVDTGTATPLPVDVPEDMDEVRFPAPDR